MTSFDFRYIQLAINVPTLSTVLYIWSDISHHFIFSQQVRWFVHASVKESFKLKDSSETVDKPLLQDHSRVAALALVERKGDFHWKVFYLSKGKVILIFFF